MPKFQWIRLAAVSYELFLTGADIIGRPDCALDGHVLSLTFEDHCQFLCFLRHALRCIISTARTFTLVERTTRGAVLHSA